MSDVFTNLSTNTDPRVFFAAERTLLAWLRTGLALIALGFVVSALGCSFGCSLLKRRGPNHPVAPRCRLDWASRLLSPARWQSSLLLSSINALLPRCLK